MPTISSVELALRPSDTLAAAVQYMTESKPRNDLMVAIAPEQP